MNKLILKEYSNGKVVYEYQPEGKGDFGEVFFDVSSSEGKLLKRAAEDTNMNVYGQKALLKVEELVHKNNIPLQCTQAWF
jgi:hypothetical protein